MSTPEPDDLPSSSKPHDDPSYPVQRGDAQWREALGSLPYEVARHGATERAFTGRYWNHWADGVYHCVGCGEALFDASAKFDAGCGWPSWWREAVPGRIERLADDSHGMRRVEVRCTRCGTHLGHVFDDGPQPTGERYCINSAAIDFRTR
ncbi:MAG: peptide-methionine (R)-S-oxide reductase MsrB [Burkholderiaceae bacterium]|nr:peptide-methionine (R)-S-oxide reductase MsrB [Aquabacterium sp.]NUP85980.1 peptide-methionine (R)-S-oxide reductase MsrB [Burkholderiaceae bacterium]